MQYKTDVNELYHEAVLIDIEPVDNFVQDMKKHGLMSRHHLDDFNRLRTIIDVRTELYRITLELLLDGDIITIFQIHGQVEPDDGLIDDMVKAKACYEAMISELQLNSDALEYIEKRLDKQY